MTYPVKTNTVVLNRGTTLVQHYEDDPNFGREVQCGPTWLYQQWEDELHQHLTYYADAYGRNKFMKNVTVHIYSSWLALPDSRYRAYCQENGSATGRSEIYLGYMINDPYGPADHKTMKGAWSHEFGHAHHNWCKIYSHPSLKAAFTYFWSTQLTTNNVPYDPSNIQYPWDRPDNPYEGYANLYRFFKGTLGEKGSSGPGTDDPVFAGFEDPKNHPEWEKMLNLQPEACAFMEKFGLKPGTLSWQGGVYGYWQFQTNYTVDGIAAGTWIAQTNYYEWHKYVGGAWNRFYPSYTRT